MQHYNMPHNLLLVAVVAIVLLLGLPSAPSPAHAQPVQESSSASDASSNVEAATSADSETLDVPDASDADALAATNPDDSSTEAISGDSDHAPSPSVSVAPANEPSDSDNGAVLEIPQMVDLPDGAVSPNDNNSQQMTQSGQGTAANDDLATADNRVGTLEDYEDQAGAVPMGPIVFPPSVTIVRFPRSPLFNPMRPPRFGVPVTSSPIILPPTSSGPLPSTSPMLMAPPRLGTFGALPGRGFAGFRR
ncbi:MAG TPA: hypothetical protein VJ728_02075 [Candidatus Binataceae bacterium]|nr:hypothetical protein [Candidatus Binataceae bacterium]